jgi:multidrug efflux system outer membrane protein
MNLGRKILGFCIMGLLTLMVNGCLLGPDYVSPEYKSYSAYRFDTNYATDSVINLRWWEIFEDPVLDTLIVQALENNVNLLATAKRIEAAKTNVGYVKADQWPAFGYGVGVSGSGIAGNNQSAIFGNPQLGWEIGFWGKYRRLTESAQAQYLASEYGRRTLQIALISSVSTAYFNLLASYSLLEISQNTFESRDSGLLIMEAKFDGGMISLMDYNQAKLQRDGAAAAIPGFKRAIALNENALSILLGHSSKSIAIGIPFSSQNVDMKIPVGLPSSLLTRRPDVLQAAEKYRSLNAQIGAAEAARWPSFSITGALGVASPSLTSFSGAGLAWSTGATLAGPIYQFGKNKKRVEIATYNAEASLLDYEGVVLQAFKEVEDALVKIETFNEERISLKSKMETAIESEVLSKVRYDEGSTTYLEVLEQQRQSFSSQLDFITVRLNVVNSYVLLYKSLGGGWLSAQEESDATAK